MKNASASDPTTRQLRQLRREARRFLQDRGRPARLPDVDKFLLGFWWRLPDDVHDRLDAIDRGRRSTRG
jgi:hypothetical protein